MGWRSAGTHDAARTATKSAKGGVLLDPTHGSNTWQREWRTGGVQTWHERREVTKPEKVAALYVLLCW
jgi:hypothetical protein